MSGYITAFFSFTLKWFHAIIILVENFDVELTDEPVKVYNFEVEDFHTYHVSGFGVLVHNANDYANPRTQNTSDLDIQKNQGN